MGSVRVLKKSTNPHHGVIGVTLVWLLYTTWSRGRRKMNSGALIFEMKFCSYLKCAFLPLLRGMHNLIYMLWMIFGPLLFGLCFKTWSHSDWSTSQAGTNGKNERWGWFYVALWSVNISSSMRLFPTFLASFGSPVLLLFEIIVSPHIVSEHKIRTHFDNNRGPKSPASPCLFFRPCIVILLGAGKNIGEISTQHNVALTVDTSVFPRCVLSRHTRTLLN